MPRWLDRALSIIAVRRSTEPRTPQTQRVPYTGSTTAGVFVTPDTAITVPTVWACLRYLSQTVAVPPWHVMRDKGRGGEVARSHPVDWLLWKRPNAEWSAFQFRETLMHWALRWGNGYAEIERDSIGRPIALWPIHPERVEVKRDAETNELFYKVHNGTAAPIELDATDMFHVRGFGEGPVGVNVMAYAAESIGWAKAAQLFGSAFFGKGMNPATVVTMKRALTAAGLDELAARFRKVYQGPRAEKTVFLDNEMDLKTLSMEPEKAQFLGTNQHLVEEVCRWFGVPPHKVQHMLRATFSNIEHQSIEVVVDSITPWVKRFEEEADYKLFGVQNRMGFYTKINLNALLRGDSAARATFYKEMSMLGVLTINDVLRLEDMPTIGPDGDHRLMQSQNTTLERIIDPPEPPAPVLPPKEPAEPTDPDDEPEEEAEARARFLRLIGVGEYAH